MDPKIGNTWLKQTQISIVQMAIYKQVIFYTFWLGSKNHLPHLQITKKVKKWGMVTLREV
jgi:hypothetical protein